jgi:uncharacterized protein YjbI with pentapeptide repeats
VRPTCAALLAGATTRFVDFRGAVADNATVLCEGASNLAGGERRWEAGPRKYGPEQFILSQVNFRLAKLSRADLNLSVVAASDFTKPCLKWRIGSCDCLRASFNRANSAGVTSERRSHVRIISRSEPDQRQPDRSKNEFQH